MIDIIQNNSENTAGQKKRAAKYINPMKFYNKDGKELQEPMEFFHFPEVWQDHFEEIDLSQPFADMTGFPGATVEEPVTIEPAKAFKFELETESPEKKTTGWGWGDSWEFLSVVLQEEKQPASNSPIQVVGASPSAGESPTMENLPKSTLPEQSVQMEILNDMRCSAYQQAQRAVERIAFGVYRDRLYWHNGQYYVEVSEDEASRLVISAFRESFRNAGARFMQDTLYYIRCEPQICISEEGLSRGFLTFENGVLDPSDGVLYTHSRMYHTFYKICANYVPHLASLDTPCFDRFLYQCGGGDPFWTERVWQIIGYILSTDTNAKAIFLLQGVSNSGKSVLADFLYRLFSKCAAISLDFHDLNEQYAVSELEGKALCVSADMPSKALDAKSVSRLKQLSGNDVVSGDVKYKKRAQFRNVAKLLMITNHPLVLHTPDQAFVRRIVAVPFRYSVPKEAWDLYLVDKFLAERDAIVTKAMAAYFRLRDNKYAFAGTYAVNDVIDAGVPAENGTDVPVAVMRFLQTFYISDPSSGVFMEDAYTLFCANGGCADIKLFSQCFSAAAGQCMQAKKIRKRRPNADNAQSYIEGIRLNPRVGLK